MRLIYLNGFKTLKNNRVKDTTNKIEENIDKAETITEQKLNDTINQIKNTTQEKKLKLEEKKEINALGNEQINSFIDLLKTCEKKKKIKLKIKLKKNVNLIKFEQTRIEISINYK